MTSPPLIEARGLTLRTRAGDVYRDVDLCVPAAALAVIAGPARSGKTALLLTLAGRMAATGGELRVAGVDGARPGVIRRLAGLGEFRGVNELDDTLTVADQVRGELALYGRARRELQAEPLRRLGLELAPQRRIADLDAPERLLLGAALGMVGEPRLLVLDELDEELTPAQRQCVLAALRRLTGAGVTVVAGALDPALAAAADVALCLETPTAEEAAHALA